LAADDELRVLNAIRAFAAGNLPNADVKKLKGAQPEAFRLRVGQWRVIYRREHNDEVVGATMLIVLIDDRKDVYR
jgi:mRNA-degrading endonuclease RelE of RelBE toxin-antitoxin system